MPVFTVKLVLSDNNGKQAEARVMTGPGASYAGAVAFALGLAERVQAVSSAVVVEVRLTSQLSPVGATVAQPSSDCTRGGVLFYSDDSQTSSVLVPSVLQLCFEGAGPYASVRITRESAALSGVLPELDSLLNGFLDGAGRPFPSAFIAGGSIQL